MTDVKQLPEAFLKEMEQLLGDEYEAYIKSYEEAWKPGLRVNTLKIMRFNVMQNLKKSQFQVRYQR